MSATVKNRVRFSVVGYSAEEMQGVGDGFISGLFARWDQALDVLDQKAPPLKVRVSRTGKRFGYPIRKSREGLRNIRDLLYTGRMRAGIRAVEARRNRVVIRATDAHSARRLNENQLKARQFGVSPKGRADIAALIARLRPVRVVAT